MAVTRSDKYFFQRGDIVIQVENTFFKIHKDILERHSGYFEDLFDKPTVEEEWVSVDDPLYLSEGISSAQAFTIICRYLYPADPGVLPIVTVGELDLWEPVLDATISLEMWKIRDHILDGLISDKENLHLATPRLLNIANRSEDDILKWDCYFELFYRVRPLSLTDALTLGSSNLALITHVREQVRNDLVWDLNPADVDTSELCPRPEACQRILVEAIRRRMNIPLRGHTMRSVFDVPSHSSMCADCSWARMELASSYRTNKLDQKVREWVSNLLPLPSSSPDHSEEPPFIE